MNETTDEHRSVFIGGFILCILRRRNSFQL